MKQPFTARQLFNSKVEKLEKRITEYYQHTQEIGTVIKLTRVLQIRAAIGMEEISQPCYTLVRQLFQIGGKSAVLKRYAYYFAEYFSAVEWAEVIDHLFAVAVFGAQLLWQIKILLLGQILTVLRC